MTRFATGLALIALLGAAAPSRAQEALAAPRETSKPALVPLEVEVVIARYDGAKRISSLPYILALNSGGGEVQLRMGTDVAVPTTSFTPVSGDGKEPRPLMSYQYRSVGTTIHSSAVPTSDGRYQLTLQIDDSSVYTNPTPGPGGGQMPAFRSFSTRNTLLLRDAQSREYTAATDRVSGEVVKVSVTLRVVK